jgi:protein-L-isoaspartate(D-aspartate) O-methyltransferase
MAYQDSPQPIGHGATISAPHMHATAIENVLSYLTPSSSPRRVLDVGSGSGYLTHLIAELIGDDGLVVGLEHIGALRDLGEANMRKSSRGRELLDNGVVKFRVGDGRKGWVEEGRSDWDVIHVGAAAKKIHEDLLEQLKAPGWYVSSSSSQRVCCSFGRI